MIHDLSDACTQWGEGEGGDAVQLQERHERVFGEAHAAGAGGRQE